MPEIYTKPAGELCQFYAEGVGCSIYPRRPKPCQVFECLWLRLFPVGRVAAEARPDLSGVMIMQHGNTGVYIAHLPEDNRDAWQEGEVGKLIDRMLRQGSIFVLMMPGEPGARVARMRKEGIDVWHEEFMEDGLVALDRRPKSEGGS